MLSSPNLDPKTGVDRLGSSSGLHTEKTGLQIAIVLLNEPVADTFSELAATSLVSGINVFEAGHLHTSEQKHEAMFLNTGDFSVMKSTLRATSH